MYQKVKIYLRNIFSRTIDETLKKKMKVGDTNNSLCLYSLLTR